MIDTPNSLLQRGRIDEARQALQSIRGKRLSAVGLTHYFDRRLTAGLTHHSHVT
jgi:hypothetical protein